VQDASVLQDLRTLSRGQVRPSPAEQAIFNLRVTSALYALVNLACTRRHENEENSSLRHVQRAEHYIGAHFSTIKTLREVAEAIGVSYDHLRHAYKELRSKNLVRYLNEVRIDRARTLLVHSRFPLKQVATMCGFRDEYYFSTVFRQFAGVPPGRYRARLANRAPRWPQKVA
jgi:AraC-like DNA-binding protein